MAPTGGGAPPLPLPRSEDLEDVRAWGRDSLAAYLVSILGAAAAEDVLRDALSSVTAAAVAAAAPGSDEEGPAVTGDAAGEQAAAVPAAPSPADYAAADRVRRSESMALPPQSDADASESGASGTGTETSTSRSSALWRRAVAKAISAKDPWAARRIDKLRMEHCRRYRFNPADSRWVADDVLVKMEQEPFASGAMRLCYRSKKLSNFSGGSVYRDWRKAPNFVAKSYKKPGIERSVYRNDVMLQMTAKALGDDYNRLTRPPKKIDFIQAALLEFPEREGRPLFAIEHLIVGPYIKFNSNSGYVSENARNTPHAFSHWTYEHTKGRMLVVDIQGVGDLYTDPQIHTLDGRGYGDGNLGLRGYALFFRTHECNALCKSMHLPEFSRCTADVKAQGNASSSSSIGSGTLYKSFLRHKSLIQDLRRQLSRARRRGPAALPETQMLRTLDSVPLVASPTALVHLETAKVYAETVLLPDIRPDEDPDDARSGGVFHLQLSASLGCALAQCILARFHAGLGPSGTQFANLCKEAESVGELRRSAALALRYTHLAAERGVRAAASALGHAFATAGGVAEGAIEAPAPALAVKWFRVALGEEEPDVASAAAEGTATEAPTDSAAGGEEGSAAGGEGALVRAPTGSEAGSELPPAGASVGAGQLFSYKSWGGEVDLEEDLLDLLEEGEEEEGEAEGEGGGGGALAAARRAALLQRDLRSGPSGRSRTQAATVDQAFALLAEAEAEALPGGSLAEHELRAEVGRLLMAGGPGLPRDPTAAAVAFSAAAEAAEAAFKGKLAAKYYEMAAEAEAAAEEEGGDSAADGGQAE